MVKTIYSNSISRLHRNHQLLEYECYRKAVNFHTSTVISHSNRASCEKGQFPKKNIKINKSLVPKDK